MFFFLAGPYTYLGHHSIEAIAKTCVHFVLKAHTKPLTDGCF